VALHSRSAARLSQRASAQEQSAAGDLNPVWEGKKYMKRVGASAAARSYDLRARLAIVVS
jgi:hypothetical protein